MTGYGSWLACNGTYCWLFISQGVPFILVLSFLLDEGNDAVSEMGLAPTIDELVTEGRVW